MKNLSALFDEKPTYRNVHLNVDEVEVVDFIEPTQEFIDDVSTMGIIHPPVICLKNKRGKKYAVLSGRRRVLSAKRLGIKVMEFRLVENISYATAVASMLTISAQRQHKPNPIAELRAIKNLIANAYSLDEIQEALGIGVQEINKIMNLDTLSEEMQEGVSNGTIKISTAYKVAKLSGSLRNKAEALFLENGTLTYQDVSDLKSVVRGNEIQDVMEQMQVQIPVREPRFRYVKKGNVLKIESSEGKVYRMDSPEDVMEVCELLNG